MEVRSIPCERVQQQAVVRMVGEQGGVIAVTETASQDRKLQFSADVVKNVLQKGLPERLGEQFGVIEVPKNSSQESVKNARQKADVWADA